MYEAEMIPNCIAMGISQKEFWQMTPRELNVFIEGYKLKRKTEDEQHWFLGGYMYSAVTIALGNAFRKKNTKEKSYFELIDKPFLSEMSEELTEEEKQKHLDKLMASLTTMESNFNLSHNTGK